MAFRAPYRWHFDAVAEDDTDAISIPAARLREDCESDKAYGDALMKTNRRTTPS